MLRLSFAVGVLLTLMGLGFLALIAMGTGFGPGGLDASFYGVGTRTALAIAAALCLAVGFTLAGLGFGHWRRPLPANTAIDHTPDARR